MSPDPVGAAKGRLKERLPGSHPRLKAGGIDAFALPRLNERKETAGKLSARPATAHPHSSKDAGCTHTVLGLLSGSTGPLATLAENREALVGRGNSSLACAW